MYNTIKENLFNNWNWIRSIRLGISIVIIVQAIQMHDMLFGLFGGFFMFQALTNTGCCAAGRCSPAINKSDDTEEIKFTEVKNK